jgi:hypothetical protein
MIHGQQNVKSNSRYSQFSESAWNHSGTSCLSVILLCKHINGLDYSNLICLLRKCWPTTNSNGHVPQIRPAKGAQSFSPDFSWSTQMPFMFAPGCAYVYRVSFLHHCQPFHKGLSSQVTYKKIGLPSMDMSYWVVALIFQTKKQEDKSKSTQMA